MNTFALILVVSVLGVSLCHGKRIGGSGRPPVRSVFVMRHCLRATPTQSGIYGAPGFNAFDNYSSHHFPTWPVPSYQCLPQGIAAIKEFGKSLSASLPKGKLAVKVDTTAKRDNDTAIALLEGLGRSTAYIPAPYLFNPVGVGLCKAPSVNETVAALKASFAANPPSKEHVDRLTRLQGVLGKGKAPPIQSIPDKVFDNGYFTGGGSVASGFSEAFLMQLGAGMEVAWGEEKEAYVNDLLTEHIWYRSVNDRALPLVARSHSIMVEEIMSFLDNPVLDDTLFLVGHDGDLDAMGELFGLEWHTAPFPPNATTPGSALRFDLDFDHNTVSVSVAYNEFTGRQDRPFKVVPANFVRYGGAPMARKDLPNTTLDELKAYLEPRLDHTCDPRN